MGDWCTIGFERDGATPRVVAAGRGGLAGLLGECGRDELSEEAHVALVRRLRWPSDPPTHPPTRPPTYPLSLSQLHVSVGRVSRFVLATILGRRVRARRRITFRMLAQGLRKLCQSVHCEASFDAGDSASLEAAPEVVAKLLQAPSMESMDGLH